MTFNYSPGDNVRFLDSSGYGNRTDAVVIGAYPNTRNPITNGRGHHAYEVRSKNKNGVEDTLAYWEYDFELAEQKYDPTQMGDRDDDI